MEKELTVKALDAILNEMIAKGEGDTVVIFETHNGEFAYRGLPKKTVWYEGKK